MKCPRRPRWRRSGPSARGGILPLLLVTIVIFSVLAAGALTIGRLVVAHQDLQHAADSLALGASYIISERGLQPGTTGLAPAEVLRRYNYSRPTRVDWAYSEPPDRLSVLTEVRLTTLDRFVPISSFFPSLIRPLSARAKARVRQNLIDSVTKRRAQLVLVLDFSSSMQLPIAANEGYAAIDVLKDSVKAVLAANLDVDIGAVFFASNVFLKTPLGYSDHHPEIKKGLDEHGAAGTTATGAALHAARELLAQSEDRGRYVILISDGEPTDGASNPYAYSEEAAREAWSAHITIFTVDIHRTGATQKQADFLRAVAGDLKNPGNPANALVATSATALADSLHKIIAGVLCELPPIDPAPQPGQPLHVFLRSPSGSETALPELPDISCDLSAFPRPPGCAPSYTYDQSQHVVKLSAAACDYITVQGNKAVVRYDRPALLQ
jgi:Mg-chelatase subunit ChlD